MSRQLQPAPRRAKHDSVVAVSTLTDTADTLTWVLGDHLALTGCFASSASTTANADGTLNSVIQYTAFGEIRLTQGLTPTKYRYTGQLAQAELGLDFYVSRFYDPLLGHFATVVDAFFNIAG